VRQMGLERMRPVAFTTVGCKLNQFETEQMRETALSAGWAASEGDAPAEVCVINTCTVTSKSDYRARQAVRRAVREHPGALIIVTGCYAQRHPEEISAIDGVDVVLGNAEKDLVGQYIGLAKQARPIVRTTDPGAFTRPDGTRRLHGFGSYTRAFVKIQDGCDNRCTYCAVPLARGPGRSKRPEDVLAEMAALAAEGYREIVLTGVHLGSYGRDLRPPASLAALLARTASVPGLARTRLSSVEPTDLTARLIGIMADTPARICPHVHVPLQSGDPSILKAMGRPYGPLDYRKAVEELASAVPRCGIGADVMVGFPGETQAAFDNTCRLVADLPLTYLHVFAYSRRPGTPAAAMPDQVEPGAKKERSRVLRELGRQKSRAFRLGLAGQTLETLVLGARGRAGAVGLAGNYVKVELVGGAAPNDLVPVVVAGVTQDGVSGAVAGREPAP